MVIVTRLEPPIPQTALALTVRLNNDLVDEFKRCVAQGGKPKLVVKDGYMVSMPPGGSTTHRHQYGPLRVEWTRFPVLATPTSRRMAAKSPLAAG